jgi:hypothetical protein
MLQEMEIQINNNQTIYSMKKNIPNGLYQNQPKIDFSELQHFENKISNQEHFEANKDRFSNQCRLVYESSLRGRS